MANTARTHFDEDISRAEQLCEQAKQLEDSGADKRLYGDIRFSAIGMAVGALDAYLCDKYVDCLSSVLKAYSNGDWQGNLPAYYRKQLLPAGEILDRSRESRPLWSIRMAARSIMEKDNMLSIGRVESMFNPILPDNQKVFAALIPVLVGYGWKKLTGPKTDAEIATLTGKSKEKATKKAISVLKERIGQTIQIRHDWIHNCGRPKSSIKDYTDRQTYSRIKEIKALVVKFDQHIEAHRKS